MAAAATEDENLDRFRQRTSADAQARLADELSKREREQHAKGQARLSELVGLNSTLPVTISSITVLNARNTRRGFLDRIFHPLLSISDNSFYTFREALNAVSASVGKLERLDIFESPISIYYDKPDPTNPSSTPTDLEVFLSVREKSRFVASSGTWAGTNDGSVYMNLLARNLFGGAESLNANASFGTRTRSAYSLGLDSPILSNPDLRVEIGGVQSATNKAWASHEERLRGAFTKLKYLTPGGHRHDFGYSGMWRQNSGLSQTASSSVRLDAGDSFKSSLSHTWTLDRRDYPLLPTRGYLVRSTTEIAGLGPLGGDVAFGKLEAEAQSIAPVPIPFYSDTKDTGISFSTSLRGGLLYPLTLGTGKAPTQSRVNDRFFLGGPSDVRGFRFAGLGPHDGADALGGDVYAAGGASILMPFPRVGREKPLRLQAFVNGGRLVALRDGRSKEQRDARVDITAQDVARSVGATVASLADELPSIAAGFGVVYALPVARFEVNFSLPLVMRRGEQARKGISLGVGLSFL